MNAPYLENFGCRLNAYETQAMKELAENAGLRDIVIINSCAVTSEAVRQARQKIRKLKRQNPQAKLIVTGCAAQTESEKFAAMDEVDIVIGNVEKMQPKTWQSLAKGEAPKVLMQDIMSVQRPEAHRIDGLLGRARAYVQVQNGCDHRCTFCIIPFGRGNSRSVPANTVVEQIKRLRDKGFNEVVLTGVDMTSWGADFENKPQLGDLVQKVLDGVPDLPRLRISSIDSIEADDALVDAMASEARLMPHFHLSLQAGDNLILKRMKRRHLREDAIEFCTLMRAKRPDIVYGADIIAGFPTETDRMFENSLKLVEECGLTWLHVFPFSPRAGTPAAKMPQVDRNLVKARAARLRELGVRQKEKYLRSLVGRNLSLLIEGKGKARSESFAEVVVSDDEQPGQIKQMHIQRFDGKALIAS